MSHMIVQHEEINSSNKDNHNKGDIISVTKAVAKKSILKTATSMPIVDQK